MPSGLKYIYSNNTALTDPTAGKLKFNSLTLSAITSFRISDTDDDSSNVASLLQQSVVGKFFVVQKDSDPSISVLFKIIADRVGHTTWEEFPVKAVNSHGVFADGDVVRVIASGSATFALQSFSGPKGRDAGIKYGYSTNTVDSDPTAGLLKFDNATLASITSLRISNTDGDGNNLSALLDLFASGTILILYKDSSPGTMLAFSISGAVTDNSGWKKFPITFISSSGALANLDQVKMLVASVGGGGGGGLDGRQGIFSKASQSIPNTTWTEITYAAPSGELVTPTAYIAAGLTAGRLKFLLPGIYHVLFSGLGYDDSAGGTVRAISMQIGLAGGPGENWTIPTQAFSPTVHDLLNDNYGVFSIEAIVRVSAADITAEAGTPGSRDIQVTTYHDKGGAWTFNQLKLVVTRLGDMPA